MAASGVILVVLGLFPKIGAIVAAIPLPVLGGAGLALFATVAASGIRALSRVNYEGNNNLIIVALSIGMGVIPIAVPDVLRALPELVPDDLRLRHQLGGRHRRAAEPAVQRRAAGSPKEAAIVAESPTVGVTPDYDVPGGVERTRAVTADDRGRSAHAPDPEGPDAGAPDEHAQH